MIDFNWVQFFEQHNIEYSTAGHSNVEIHCIWCGAEDQSHHLSVSIEGFGYHCWKNNRHSGINPTRLVHALLNCSWEQAIRITGQVALPNDFLSQVQGTLQPPAEANVDIKLPDEAKPLSNLPSCQPFIGYLKRRGFTQPQINQFNDNYDLHYCTRGLYAGRVIFPIYSRRKLVAFTGRTIHQSVELRYKAEGPTTQHLIWYDRLMKMDADTIYLCEGPFDSLKVNVFGQQYGICSTCFFTSGPSDAQVNLLSELVLKFKHRYLLLDQGATMMAMLSSSKFDPMDVIIKQLPPGVPDPGALTPQQFLQLIHK